MSLPLPSLPRTVFLARLSAARNSRNTMPNGALWCATTAPMDAVALWPIRVMRRLAANRSSGRRRPGSKPKPLASSNLRCNRLPPARSAPLRSPKPILSSGAMPL